MYSVRCEGGVFTGDGNINHLQTIGCHCGYGYDAVGMKQLVPSYDTL